MTAEGKRKSGGDAMVRPPDDIEDLARRGEEYYDKFLRAKLEPGHRGEYLYLDVETGEYELDADEVAAMERATARHPDSVFYILRVGYPASVYIGGSPKPQRSSCGRPPSLRRFRKGCPLESELTTDRCGGTTVSPAKHPKPTRPRPTARDGTPLC